MAGRIYPLFVLQDPRRNLYAPIWRNAGKEHLMCYIIIHIFCATYNSFEKIKSGKQQKTKDTNAGAKRTGKWRVM